MSDLVITIINYSSSSAEPINSSLQQEYLTTESSQDRFDSLAKAASKQLRSYLQRLNTVLTRFLKSQKVVTSILSCRRNPMLKRSSRAHRNSSKSCNNSGSSTSDGSDPYRYLTSPLALPLFSFLIPVFSIFAHIFTNGVAK